VKKSATFRLSESARKIVAGLSAKMGISQAAVIELALRQMEKKETSQ
jgi:hypothetical protein